MNGERFVVERKSGTAKSCADLETEFDRYFRKIWDPQSAVFSFNRKEGNSCGKPT